MILTYREPLDEVVTSEKTRGFINHLDCPGVMCSDHWHSCSELLFIFDGCVLQTVNSFQFTLQQGDTLLIASGDIHNTQALTDHCYVGVVQFENPNHSPSHILSAQGNSSLLSQLFTQLNEEYTLQQPGYHTMIQGLLLQILGLLERYGKRLPHSIPPSAEALRIEEYIREHLFDGITLSSVAAFAGYSDSHFSRLFQQITGLSFRQYIEKIRMNAARKLILEGTPLGEISQMLGYDSPSSFSRAFKRNFLQTPSRYQKYQQLHKNQQNME